jgi:hypothetical protein
MFEKPSNVKVRYTLDDSGEFMVLVVVDEFLRRCQRRRSVGWIALTAEGDVGQIKT